MTHQPENTIDPANEEVIQAFLDDLDARPPRKRGRKPGAGLALSGAERNSIYRERKKQAGTRARGGREYACRSYDGLERVVPNFIGLDGESVDVEGGPDRYVLLAASNGSEVSNWEAGLSTRDCFEYLLGLARSTLSGSKTQAPRARFIWFGMNYDINMILRDVPQEVFIHLWKYGTARWWDPDRHGHYYCISWTPGKRFALSLRARQAGKKDRTLAAFSSNDVFGFCQEGFVKAANGWRILAEGDEKTALLAEMKGLRGKFSQLAATDQGREKIRTYNGLEVDLLAEMGQKIWETHKSLDLNLGSMHGAGATARLMLDQHRVADHIKNVMPEAVQDHVLRAYFGGRVQLHRQGRFKEVYSYDLHSAYPWAAYTLPSLKDSRWYRTAEFDPSLWGVWLVEWDCAAISQLPEAERHLIYPFPFRTESGRIKWAQQGKGWYWTPEVAAAMRLLPGMVRVLEGDVLFLPNAAIHPFAFVGPLYEERLRLKQGTPYDIREKVIKLGLNALYGKMAEGGHRHGSENAKIRPPKHQSYIYAGMITSQVRATMLEVAMRKPRDVIGFATDCLFSRVDLGLPLSEALGGWEGKRGTNGLFLQPGVYRVHDSDGKVKTQHNRGFLPSEFDWEQVDRAWDAYPDQGTRLAFPSRRFIGLGAALMNQQSWPGNWRTWQTGTRELNPFSERQIPFPQYADTPDECARFGPSQIVGMFPEAGLSQPYAPRLAWEPGEEDYLTQTEYLTQPEMFD